MTLVLDSGGLSALAGDQARLAELRRRGLWPAQVPSAVLVEALTADHHRDVQVNRLLRACQVRDLDESLARERPGCGRQPVGPERSRPSTRSWPPTPHAAQIPLSSPVIRPA